MITLTSCSYYAFYPQTGSSQPPPANPNLVKIYAGDPDLDYTVIGSIAVDVEGDERKAQEYLKKKAAGLGADAVIKVYLTTNNPFSTRIRISGVAVNVGGV